MPANGGPQFGLGFSTAKLWSAEDREIGTTPDETIVQPSEAAEILSAACLVSRSAGRETMPRIILSQLKWQGAEKAARPTSL
jgi:hypothetical protein